MDICYIIGAGDVFPVDIKAVDSDCIICADGGYRHCAIFGREPDIALGDFDSLGHVPETPNRRVYPCEKDDSDMFLAVEEGLGRGYRTFVIYGGLGGERMDHSVANLQLLHYIALKGARGFLVHASTVFTAVCDGEVKFRSSCKGYISVFSLTDVSRSVTIKNLKYQTESVDLYNYAARGLSNEFIGCESSVRVEKGTLLISWKGSYSDCL